MFITCHSCCTSLLMLISQIHFLFLTKNGFRDTCSVMKAKWKVYTSAFCNGFCLKFGHQKHSPKSGRGLSSPQLIVLHVECDVLKLWMEDLWSLCDITQAPSMGLFIMSCHPIEEGHINPAKSLILRRYFLVILSCSTSIGWDIIIIMTMHTWMVFELFDDDFCNEYMIFKLAKYWRCLLFNT